MLQTHASVACHGVNSPHTVTLAFVGLQSLRAPCLRWHVVQCPHAGSWLIDGQVQRQAHVSQADIPVFHDQDVLRLNVPVQGVLQAKTGSLKTLVLNP